MTNRNSTKCHLGQKSRHSFEKDAHRWVFSLSSRPTQKIFDRKKQPTGFLNYRPPGAGQGRAESGRTGQDRLCRWRPRLSRLRRRTETETSRLFFSRHIFLIRSFFFCFRAMTRSFWNPAIHLISMSSKVPGVKLLGGDSSLLSPPSPPAAFENKMSFLDAER